MTAPSDNSTADRLSFRSDTGVPFAAVYSDDAEPHREYEGSMVSFYDTRFAFTAHGQFVADYYVETLIEDEAELCNRGLALVGYVPEWSIDPGNMVRVISWLKAKPWRAFQRRHATAGTRPS
jgi:hypothetical protein